MQVRRMTSDPVKRRFKRPDVTVCVDSLVAVPRQDNVWPPSLFQLCSHTHFDKHVALVKDTTIFFGHVPSYFTFVPKCFTLVDCVLVVKVHQDDLGQEGAG